MANNVKITINNRETFTGRLIGVIDAQECRAIMNAEDAARKIYTAESVSIDDLPAISKKRFVIATSNYSGDGRREIFISPVVKYITYLHKKQTYNCADDNEYRIEDI